MTACHMSPTHFHAPTSQTEEGVSLASPQGKDRAPDRDTGTHWDKDHLVTLLMES